MATVTRMEAAHQSQVASRLLSQDSRRVAVAHHAMAVTTGVVTVVTSNTLRAPQASAPTDTTATTETTGTAVTVRTVTSHPARRTAPGVGDTSRTAEASHSTRTSLTSSRTVVEASQPGTRSSSNNNNSSMVSAHPLHSVHLSLLPICRHCQVIHQSAFCRVKRKLNSVLLNSI